MERSLPSSMPVLDKPAFAKASVGRPGEEAPFTSVSCELAIVFCLTLKLIATPIKCHSCHHLKLMPYKNRIFYIDF